jgi:putative transposase
MARPLRFALAGATYHVYCRGNRKEPIFHSNRDYLVFLAKLDEALTKYDCVCYTFCLMPNHYHVYMKTRRPNLSAGIHQLNAGYANWLKAKYKIAGHVFQGRFGSILVEDSAYALFLSAYIHLNPVRAKICSLPGSYRWSSYEYVCGRGDTALKNFDRRFVLGFLDADLERAVPQYERYVRDMMRSSCGKPPINQGTFLGSDEFARGIRTKINIQGNRRENPSVLRRQPGALSPELILAAVRLAQRGSLLATEMGSGELAPLGADEMAAAKAATDEVSRLARKMAIFLEKKYLDQTLGEIGHRWDLDYGAVAQIVRRMESRLGTDIILMRTLRRAEELLRVPGLYENVKC